MERCHLVFSSAKSQPHASMRLGFSTESYQYVSSRTTDCNRKTVRAWTGQVRRGHASVRRQVFCPLASTEVETGAVTRKFQPFVAKRDAKKVMEDFKCMARLEEGTLVICPLSSEWVIPAADLLTDVFADSMGYINSYRKFLNNQIREYLKLHIMLPPKAVVLVALLVHPAGVDSTMYFTDASEEDSESDWEPYESMGLDDTPGDHQDEQGSPSSPLHDDLPFMTTTTTSHTDPQPHMGHPIPGASRRSPKGAQEVSAAILNDAPEAHLAFARSPNTSPVDHNGTGASAPEVTRSSGSKDPQHADSVSAGLSSLGAVTEDLLSSMSECFAAIDRLNRQLSEAVSSATGVAPRLAPAEPCLPEASAVSDVSAVSSRMTSGSRVDRHVGLSFVDLEEPAARVQEEDAQEGLQPVQGEVGMMSCSVSSDAPPDQLRADAGVRLVGTVELSFNESTRSKSLTLNPPQCATYLCNMAVHTSQRRRGIGLKLLQAAENLAMAVGERDIYLHLRFQDKPAAMLYERAGYREVGRDVFLVKLIGCDQRYLMHKRLHSTDQL